MVRSRAVRAMLAVALLGSAAWGWSAGARATATYSATVVDTIDGDTIDVRFGNGRVERVRILGADTPETKDPRKPVQCFGAEASAHTHERLTGRDVGPVHVFARRLAANHRPVRIRFVIVPGFTDDLDEVGRMADFAAGLGNVERVDVLPFHQLGRFKWERLGMVYPLKDEPPPTPETIGRDITRFRAAGMHSV